MVTVSDRDMTTCDRCPQPHTADWWKPEGRHTIRLCTHHDRKHGDALERDGFTRYERLGADALG